MHKKNLFLFIVLNIINLLFFIVIIRQGNIIRADAPVGFLEFLLKKMIQGTAVSCVIGLPILLMNRNTHAKSILPMVASLFTLLLMGFFAVLLILESCDDDEGHCRHFQLYEIGKLFQAA